MRGYAHSDIVDAVRASGGEVYAITSEPQALAERAAEDWELNFSCVGDPHHEIAALVEERGWFRLRTFAVGEFLSRSTPFDVQHPKGIFQPGVLALTRDERVLYRWRSIPTRENGGGAGGRPTEQEVWTAVSAALDATASAADDAADAPLDSNTYSSGSRRVPFPFFACLLMAHGWFLRPRAFTYQADGRNPMSKVPRMLPRLVGFVLAWIALFLLAPWPLAPVALAAYLPVGIKGIRDIYRTFPKETPAD
ncbi:MAG: hypothetical protein AAF515_10000 [Pseudomonadota bacterium]